MKFRIKARRKEKNKKTPARTYVSSQIPINSLQEFKALARNEEIDLFGAFDKQNERVNKRKKFLFGQKLCSFFSKLKKIRSPRVRRSQSHPALIAGAFCGVGSVSMLCAALLVYALFGSYGGNYTTVVIPDLITLTESEALAAGEDLFEFSVIYASNPDAKTGSVISQSPPPNVTRKAYRGKKKLHITLTVNAPDKAITVPQTVGLSLRDASLALKNAGFAITVIKEYSDDVPEGRVIFCSNDEGSKVSADTPIVLRVSKGKESEHISLPNLSGMSEADAIDLLKDRKFEIGKITYVESNLPIGRVVSQQYSAGTTLAQGTKISFAVSGGIRFSQ